MAGREEGSGAQQSLEVMGVVTEVHGLTTEEYWHTIGAAQLAALPLAARQTPPRHHPPTTSRHPPTLRACDAGRPCQVPVWERPAAVAPRHRHRQRSGGQPYTARRAGDHCVPGQRWNTMAASCQFPHSLASLPSAGPDHPGLLWGSSRVHSDLQGGCEAHTASSFADVPLEGSSVVSSRHLPNQPPSGPLSPIAPMQAGTVPFSPEQIAERALATAQDCPSYSLLNFNCEHFAVLCCTNQRLSTQVAEAGGAAIGIGVLSMAVPFLAPFTLGSLLTGRRAPLCQRRCPPCLLFAFHAIATARPHLLLPHALRRRCAADGRRHEGRHLGHRALCALRGLPHYSNANAVSAARQVKSVDTAQRRFREDCLNNLPLYNEWQGCTAALLACGASRCKAQRPVQAIISSTLSCILQIQRHSEPLLKHNDPTPR